MRTLTAHNTTETTNTITEPFYLVELGFTTPVYLSSLKDITLSSKDYSASRKFTLSIASDKSGGQSGTILISDVDNLYSALLLSEGCAGKTITIYQAYGTPTASDLVTLFDGIMDESHISDAQVSISIFSQYSTTNFPNIYITQPDFNFLPPKGTIIQSGNTTITLDSY